MSTPSLRATRHAVYNLNYHFVWIPKYRKQILTGVLQTRLKEIFAGISQEYGFDMLATEIMPDHIHLFVSAPPRWSPADIVKKFKGVSGTQLFLEYPQLKKELRRGKIWSRSYYVGTAGTVTAETIRRYVDEQKTKRAE